MLVMALLLSLRILLQIRRLVVSSPDTGDQFNTLGGDGPMDDATNKVANRLMLIVAATMANTAEWIPQKFLIYIVRDTDHGQV